MMDLYQIDEIEPVHQRISLRITAEAAPEATRIKCDYGADACSNFNTDPNCVGGCGRGMITNMPRTTEEVIWSPRAWRVEHGDEKTPDISAIIQEVIDMPGWTAGNSVNLIIEPVMDGTTGARVAEAGSIFGPPVSFQ